MEKLFIDYFSELQADMISICLEYIENRAEKIYIYCSYEVNTISCDFFYQISGKLFRKHKVNDVAVGELNWDVSSERQVATLNILNENMHKLIQLCKSNEQSVPTQIKIIYNVEKNSMDSNCKYDIVYSKTNKSSNDIVSEWFEEIKNI